MTLPQDDGKVKKGEFTLVEALEIVGSGWYTNFLAVTGGLLTLAAMASMQSMFFILPAVRCELLIGAAELGLLGSISYLGSMLSASWFGFLVDLYGRRKILLITATGSSCGAILASLSPNIPTLMLFCFSTGVMLGGVLGNPYVYVSEFCPPKIRPDKLMIVSIVASIANIFSPCAAWLAMWLDISVPISGLLVFTSWRLYLIVNSFPMIVSTLLLLYLPESPKYLLSKSKTAAAIASLSRVYAANHRIPKETFPVVRLRLELEDTQGESKKPDGFFSFLCCMYHQVKELFSPSLWIYTVICSAMKFAVIGLYSVIYVWLPEETDRLLKYWEGHNTYVTLCDVMAMTGYNKWGRCQPENQTYLVNISVGVVYSILCVVMIYAVRFFRLKTIIGSNILMTAVICLGSLMYQSLYPILTSLGLMVAILAASQPAVYASVVHFFPTPLRGTATAVCVVFGRLAVPIGSSLFGAAFHSHCFLAYSTLATILAVVAVICFMTPDKKNEVDASS